MYYIWKEQVQVKIRQESFKIFEAFVTAMVFRVGNHPPPCGHLASGCRGGQHRGWRRWAVQSVDPLGGKGWCYTICHNNTDTCTSRYDASIFIYIRNYLKYWKIYRLYRYILYQKLLEIWNIYRYMWYIYIYIQSSERMFVEECS